MNINIARARWRRNRAKYRERYPQKIKDHKFIQLLLLKAEVMLHYGNGELECAVCGEDRIKCLSMDHVGGGGNRHRKEIGLGTGEKFYRWLRKNNYPDGYRTLCMNCQFLEQE